MILERTNWADECSALYLARSELSAFPTDCRASPCPFLLPWVTWCCAGLAFCHLLNWSSAACLLTKSRFFLLTWCPRFSLHMECGAWPLALISSRPGFQLHPCHILAVRPQNLTWILSKIGFLICKTGVVLALRECWEDESEAGAQSRVCVVVAPAAISSFFHPLALTHPVLFRDRHRTVAP